MKILWLSHFLLFPETGFGALQRSRNLLIQLSKYHDIYLICNLRDKDIENNVSLKYAKNDLQRYCGEIVFVENRYNGGPWRRYITEVKSLSLTKPYSILVHQSKRLIKTAMAFLNRNNIDLVYSDTLGLFEPVLNEVSVPCTINHHNVESDMMFKRARNSKQIVKKALLYQEAWKIRAYERKYCHKYNINLVVSSLDGERLKKINRNAKIAVIENGTDCNYFEFYPRERLGNKIIFVGGLDWYPNLDAMIYFCNDVWPLLKRDVPDIRLTIVGKKAGTEFDSIVLRTSRIKITGFLSDVRPYVREASVFVCPIRDGGGTKLKILDAMAQGIPVVSSSLGCEGLDVTDGEDIYIANEPKEYASKIKMLLADIEEQNRLAQNAYKLIRKNYSYDVIGSEFNDVIKGSLT